MMRRPLLPATLIVVLTSSLGLAQSDAPAYQKPPQAIVDIMDAAPLPGVAVSPLRDVIALVPRRSMPSIAELARPWLGLAGSRIDPTNSGPRLVQPGRASRSGRLRPGAERRIPVPAGSNIGLVGFSPDGKRLAFTNTRDTRIELHIADVATAGPRSSTAR